MDYSRLYIEHAHDQIFKLEFLAKNTHTREYAHEYGEYGLSEFTYLSTNSHVHSNIFILVKAAISIAHGSRQICLSH